MADTSGLSPATPASNADPPAPERAALRGGFRTNLISVLAALIGLAAGAIAYGLYTLIGLITNLVFFQRFAAGLPSIRTNPLGLAVIVVPALGGLVVGVMARYGSPKIRGHGIPEAMEAVLVNRSRIQPRVAFLKPTSAALAIGTGGPFGAEGPIIQTGGAFGSLVGQLIHTTAAERKVLLASGAAAGMAATFSTPIAAVVLAIELLLFEFKSRSFIPLVIASTLATTVHFALLGRGPMLSVAPVDFGVPAGLPFYVLLGLLCGLAAAGFNRAFYWVEDRFESLPLDRMWWPAIGGLGLGVIGYFVPRVLGVGYDTITDILNARLPITLLVLIAVFKSLALMVSLGSGTSGGLLAPMFMAGAALGGAFAMAVNRLLPAVHLAPGAFALVAMAAFFGASSRATFAFIIFAFEITRDYDAILPLMLVCVLADGVALLLERNSIMTEKLARRGLSVPTDYETDPLDRVTVAEVMNPDPATVPGTMTVADLAGRIAAGEPRLARPRALPILGEGGVLVAVITRGDLVRALAADPSGTRTVLEAGSRPPVTAFPDEPLRRAVDRMIRCDVGRLPVVSRRDPGRLVGYLGRAEVLSAQRRRLDEESRLEQGWLSRRPKRDAGARTGSTGGTAPAEVPATPPPPGASRRR